MKKYYNLVISVLDVDANRIDSHDISGSSNKKEMLIARERLDREIKAGKYDHMKLNGCTIEADIEVHNNDTWELLYIM